jgi:hypothetical protein
MQIQTEALQHPTQASLVRLNVYEMDAPPVAVYGMDALMRHGRFLVTEERIGSTKVVATLGSFVTKTEALDRARRRGVELEAQHYRRLSPSLDHS